MQEEAANICTAHGSVWYPGQSSCTFDQAHGTGGIECVRPASDITERLRREFRVKSWWPGMDSFDTARGETEPHPVAEEAAQEIGRLRSALWAIVRYEPEMEYLGDEFASEVAACAACEVWRRKNHPLQNMCESHVGRVYAAQDGRDRVRANQHAALRQIARAALDTDHSSNARARYTLDQWNERPGAEGSVIIDERWSASRSTERGPLRLCGECGARHRGNDDNTLCGLFTPIDEPCTICDGTGIVPDGLPSNGPAPCSSCGPDNGSRGES